MAIARQFLHLPCAQTPRASSPSLQSRLFTSSHPLSSSIPSSNKLPTLFKHKNEVIIEPVALSNSDSIVPADGEDGVSLGTMKLPPNTDIARFETLLFQWANSLCQGSNLPLPLPLKVDRVQGGARLGFITVDDGKTEVPVYIDCLVFPASKDSGPLFRAIRNGPLKDKVAPGEERIIRGLLQALQKSAEIARI